MRQFGGEKCGKGLSEGKALSHLCIAMRAIFEKTAADRTYLFDIAMNYLLSHGLPDSRPILQQILGGLGL